MHTARPYYRSRWWTPGFSVSLGGGGHPYGLLGAVAGLAYIASVAVLRARS
jgi:hypothetical protein